MRREEEEEEEEEEDDDEEGEEEEAKLSDDVRPDDCMVGLKLLVYGALS